MVAEITWDVLSGVTKTASDVLSGVANRCGMFCPGCQKMAWDVLPRDGLSYILILRVFNVFFHRITLVLLNPQLTIFENTVGQEQLASDEAI